MFLEFIGEKEVPTPRIMFLVLDLALEPPLDQYPSLRRKS
jgi:hypothetical protein